MKKGVKIAIIVSSVVVALGLAAFLAWWFWPRDEAASEAKSTVCELTCGLEESFGFADLLPLGVQEKEAIETVFPGTEFSEPLVIGNSILFGSPEGFGDALWDRGRQLFEEMVRRKPDLRDKLILVMQGFDGETLPPGQTARTIIMAAQLGGTVPFNPDFQVTNVPEDTEARLFLDASKFETGVCPTACSAP